MLKAWSSLWFVVALSSACGRSGYEPAEWLSTSWQYRQKVTVLASAVDSSLDNFPVYVNLADLGPNFVDSAQADGADIRVTDSTGVDELAREVVRFDPTTGRGELYFRAATISQSEDTDFYLYYGNPDAGEPGVDDALGARGVWDSAYEGVWHFEEEPDSDSGCGRNRACNSVSEEHLGEIGGDFIAPAQVDGLLGGSLRFDGLRDAVAMPTLSGTGFPQTFGTLSILFQFDCDAAANGNESQMFDSYRPSNNHFFLRCNPGPSGQNFQMAVQSIDLTEGYVFSHSFDVDKVGWNQIVVRYELDVFEMTLLVDGVILASHPVPESWAPTDQIFMLGRDNAGSPMGIIDDVRLSSVARSDDWLASSFTNIRRPSEFYAVAAFETPAQINPD